MAPELRTAGQQGTNGLFAAAVLCIMIPTYYKAATTRSWALARIRGVSFLLLTYLSLSLITLGAILDFFQPTHFTCVASTWLLQLGLTGTMTAIAIKSLWGLSGLDQFSRTTRRSARRDRRRAARLSAGSLATTTLGDSPRVRPPHEAQPEATRPPTRWMLFKDAVGFMFWDKADLVLDLVFIERVRYLAFGVSMCWPLFWLTLYTATDPPKPLADHACGSDFAVYATFAVLMFDIVWAIVALGANFALYRVGSDEFLKAKKPRQRARITPMTTVTELLPAGVSADQPNRTRGGPVTQPPLAVGQERTTGSASSESPQTPPTQSRGGGASRRVSSRRFEVVAFSEADVSMSHGITTIGCSLFVVLGSATWSVSEPFLTLAARDVILQTFSLLFVLFALLALAIPHWQSVQAGSELDRGKALADLRKYVTGSMKYGMADPPGDDEITTAAEFFAPTEKIFDLWDQEQLKDLPPYELIAIVHRMMLAFNRSGGASSAGEDYEAEYSKAKGWAVVLGPYGWFRLTLQKHFSVGLARSMILKAFSMRGADLDEARFKLLEFRKKRGKRNTDKYPKPFGRQGGLGGRALPSSGSREAGGHKGRRARDADSDRVSPLQPVSPRVLEIRAAPGSGGSPHDDDARQLRQQASVRARRARGHLRSRSAMHLPKSGTPLYITCEVDEFQGPRRDRSITHVHGNGAGGSPLDRDVQAILDQRLLEDQTADVVAGSPTPQGAHSIPSREVEIVVDADELVAAV